MKPIDDHTLGAFVDGQLDPTEQAHILQSMVVDRELLGRVQELRRAKDLMKLGFGDVQAPTRGRLEQTDQGVWRPGVVASLLLLVVSFGAGFGTHLWSQQALSGATVPMQAAIPQAERVVLHISEPNPRLFARVLDDARTILGDSRAQNTQVEVIANAGGLGLLRLETSGFLDEIRELQTEFPNIHFVACANAIAALRGEGVDPQFPDGVQTDTAAFDYILQRVQEGWEYRKLTASAI